MRSLVGVGEREQRREDDDLEPFAVVDVESVRVKKKDPALDSDLMGKEERTCRLRL